MISKGNRVKFARFVLLAVSEEAKTCLKFFFVQCIIKQLLDSVFVISRIIKVSVRVISLSLRLRLMTLTSTLIILDITKTSSNNCLLLVMDLPDSLDEKLQYGVGGSHTTFKCYIGDFMGLSRD